MGVSNAWSADWHLQNNASKIYFSDLTTNWVPTYANSHHIIFLMGRDNTYGSQSIGSQAYDMKFLSNTRLWYYNVPKWGDGDEGRYQYIAFRYATSAWTNWESNNTVTNRATWQNSKYTMTRNDNIAGKTLYYEPESSASNTNTTVTGYLPKYSATADIKVSEDGGDTYNETHNIALGILTLKGTYMDGDAATKQTTETTNGTYNYVYKDIPVTGEFTLTNTSVTNDAYEFVGFGTGDKPTINSNTHTWNVTGNTTYYAFYKHKQYNVTYGVHSSTGGFIKLNSGNQITSNSSCNINHGTSITFTAAPTTGYQIVGWYSDANCTNQLQNGGNTYNAGTLTAAKTVYVKFEETKYDVTIQAGVNGSVNPSGVKKVGNVTPVTITATANNGYTFKNWTKTGNVTITDANSASTTIKATGTGTVTANFETAKRIYLKPAGDNHQWATGAPRYAVYVLDDQTWHNMTRINDGDSDTGNDIYYCDIKSTDQEVIFCRMDPSAAANNWENRWTQTEDLTLPDNCNLFDIDKDASTDKNVKATGTWMEYNAWHLAGAFNEWALCGQTFKKQEDGSFTFTQHLELGTYQFKLLHNGDWYGNNGTMVRGTSTGWTMSTSENNCKITADYTGDYTFTFDASTKKLTVRYPILITLKNSIFGPYGIKYNEQSYFSKDDEDVIINVPYGATINFIEGQPYSDIYTGGIMQSAPEVDKKRQVELNQPFTVLNDVTFESNYVTKDVQVVYLGVPNDPELNWNKQDSYDNFIWRHDSYSGLDMTSRNDRGEYVFTINNVKYYKFNIQPGCNHFCFQRKLSKVGDDEPNGNVDHSRTLSYYYEVLTTDVNCYMLDRNLGMYGDKHLGYWCTLPPQSGDYRLLYVEQVVEKNAEGYTIITRKKAHPSDVVKASEITQEGVIVSLHTYKDRTYEAKLDGVETYTSSNNPEIILQRYDGSKWVDEEWHMVYGPLETLPIMANLPGRKNASPSSDIDDLQYHDGIEIIKQDVLNHPDKGNGVWNFYIVKNGSTVTLDLNRTHRYTGKYYIRTNAAFGEWNSYKGSDNHMTRSDVSKRNSNYSHYYCKWIDQEGTNVTYTIANDYGMAISDTLTADKTDIWGTPIADAKKIVTDGTLPTNNEYRGANVRFSWNEKSNFLHRAYLASSTNVENRFLVLKGKSDQLYNAEGQALTQGANGSDRWGLNANEEIFTDISNWVYYADVQMVPNADLKLTAKYMDKVQYFVGQESNWNNTILKSEEECSDKYLIRLLYDFKTNELISAYVPGGQEGKEIEAIETNLMLIRKENETPRQLSFNANKMEDVGKQAYGVLELTQATLEDNDKNVYERSLYWISFPFDVRITDIFGFGEYGKHWIIQSYDGAKRAREGLWADSETNWVYHFDPNTLNAGTSDQGIMKRGVGYVVALNLKNIQAETPFVGRITTIALYFPSTTTITGHIDNTTSVTIDVPEHVCTIYRQTPDGDRRIKDSHWNVIGVPSYINALGDFSGKISAIAEDLKFYYSWQGDHDKYEPVSKKSGVSFNSLNAYMVQFAGNLQWTNVLNENPAGMAAKRNSDNMQEHHLCLELQQNGNEQDRTFIQLQEDEVTTAFDFNYDLCKIINKGANIYSLIATDRDPIEVAGNVLPVEEAIIPLGIKTDAAGEYTFAMPDGTDGIVVELIDYETNTRTNMLLDEYTINLGKGTFENRFALHVKPDKTTTSVDNLGNEATGDKVKKYLIDGILYMQKDGALYDAQGKLVR